MVPERGSLVDGMGWGASMPDMISFLFEQSESLMETAQRCTDPTITSELVSIAEVLDAKAGELKRGDCASPEIEVGA